MSLKHVGGKSDGGIDLVGWWLLPSRIENDPPQRTSVVGVDPETYRHIRVIAQCKAEKKKVGPVYVRELEGVFSRYTDTSRVVSSSRQLNSPIAALLVSESPFTRAAVLRAQSSLVPFLLLHIPPPEDQMGHGQLGTVFWNPALGSEVLGGKFELRWERCVKYGGRPVMWSRGKNESSMDAKARNDSL
jgi:Protein of unknown function (DUF2034)